MAAWAHALMFVFIDDAHHTLRRNFSHKTFSLITVLKPSFDSVSLQSGVSYEASADTFGRDYRSPQQGARYD